MAVTRTYLVKKCVLNAIFLCAASMGFAQEATQAQNTTKVQDAQVLPIIAFDRDRIQANARMGIALALQIDQLQQEIVAQNAQIFKDLEAEETEIAVLKKTLSEEDFTARAKNFDDKVTKIRAEQAAKAKEVEAQYELSLRAFEQNLNVVLAGIAGDFNAVAVFERQQLYLMSGAIDISDEAIKRLDAQSDTSVSQVISPTLTPEKADPAQ
jgi:Skp family chaperone for outer membrane proteins